MATYSNNTTIKISTAVSATVTVSAFNIGQSLYTVPANCEFEYAVFIDGSGGSGIANVTSGGVVVLRNGSPSFLASGSYIAGPGTNIRGNYDSGGNSVCSLSGVLRQNTP